MTSYYGGPIGTHQRSFERYHPRPPTASPFPRLGVRNPNPKLQSLLSQERAKLRISNLAGTFKARYKIGRKGRWAYSWTAHVFEYTPIVSAMGKATNFKFGTTGTFTGSIRTNTHEKFWRKGSQGVSRDWPNFLSTPYYLSSA